MLQALKAACNEAIGVLVARTGQAAAIWDRLLAAVVVAPAAQTDSAIVKYDISYQLAEIEVGRAAAPVSSFSIACHQLLRVPM